jgi:DNA-binding beta-propeller fold protein YncE
MRRGALLLLLGLLVLAGCGGGSHKATQSDPPKTATGADPVRRVATIKRLVPVAAGNLASAIQDAAAAPYSGGAVLLGGLTSADASSDEIVTATRAGSQRVGRIPTALHDSAAVKIGRSAYLFGGGTASTQLDTIWMVDPATGAAQATGHLPTGSSDQSAAVIGHTAYIVGGYTGSTRWLDTIVAWSPGGSAHVVAHLPHTLRYAAVTAAGGRIVIAGGSLENGTASDSVYAFLPATRKVVRIGRLPAATTHAAAAAIGATAFVIGGRGASVGTPTDRIVAVDPVKRTVHVVGSLGAPLSDLAAVSDPRGILLAGGRDASGTVSSLTELVPSTRPARVTQAVVKNVYAADRVGNFSPAVRHALPYVYVPNSSSGTVDVIDQRTFKVVEHFAVGALPQHVVPGWDLKTLYVTNDLGNTLTPINPNTGKPGHTIPVDDPYNMYFTPDGHNAIVVAERLHRLDFRDPHTFKLRHSLSVPCSGADHMDFSADGSYAIVSCEFSSQLLKVNIAAQRVDGVLTLHPGAAPQDVKLSPDGAVFYVADMNSNGVWLVDGNTFRVLRFMPTGAGAHGLYPSRDDRFLYVTNRGEGSISVISFSTRHVVKKWRIAGGGSPDMGNVSANGKILWLTGRWNGVVYAISTANGRLLAKIPVGAGPHGLCVWPQPGRYSLGHTGILR